MVTFETKCWEGDWEVLLKTRFLEEQIRRNGHPFSERLLFINNVRNVDEVAHYARRLVATGVLTAAHVVERYAAEALQFFELSRDGFGGGYVYSIAELVGIYLCRTPWLLHYAGDAIPEVRAPWIAHALEYFSENATAAVANPTWNCCYEQAAGEAVADGGSFFVGYGFSDQCYLVRTADFRAPIYGETHALGARFPRHGGESFEKRVDAWMRNHGRQRLTHKRATYRHLRAHDLRALARQLTL